MCSSDLVGDGDLNIQHEGSTKLTITQSGYVGIGTSDFTAPILDNELNINGDIGFINTANIKVKDGGLHFYINADGGTTDKNLFTIWHELNETENQAKSILLVDEVGKVGFGSIDPAAQVHIVKKGTNNLLRVGTSDSAYDLFVDSSGKVGIGISTPTEILEANGAIKLANSVGNTAGVIRFASNKFEGNTDGTAGGWVDLGASAIWSTEGSDIFRGSGKVGIGHSYPSANLEVTGNAASFLIFRAASELTANALVVSGNGFVGIGRSEPLVTLHEIGRAHV